MFSHFLKRCTICHFTSYTYTVLRIYCDNVKDFIILLFKMAEMFSRTIMAYGFDLLLDDFHQYRHHQRKVSIKLSIESVFAML